MGFSNARLDRGLGMVAAGVLACAGLSWGQGAAPRTDLNGDGVVNDRDVMEWYRGFHARNTLTPAQLVRFDLNRDGSLGGHDLNEFGLAMGWANFGRLNLNLLMAEASSLGWYDERKDFNSDGRVDQGDVVIWLTALVAPQGLPPAIVQAADVNADGQLTGHDLAEVLRVMGDAGRVIDVNALRMQVQVAAAPPAAPPSPEPEIGGSTSLGFGANGSSGSASSASSSSSSAPLASSNKRGASRSLAGGAPPAGGGGGIGPVIPGGGPGPGLGVEPTATPVSTGFGADARAIARWDVVPFQSFSGEMNVGVVAFHVNGIDRVEFSANGGAWVSTSQMRLNPQTGVYEYWATIRANEFPDGVVEVRATAYPTRGVARTLDGLKLYANSRGTLEQRIRWATVAGNDATGDGTQARPFRSIYRAMQSLSQSGGATGADHGVVMLGAGEYEYKRPNGTQTPVSTNVWITVQAAPGVNRDAVSIVSAAGGQSNGGMNTKLVRLKNVTLRGMLDTVTPLEDYLWLDGVKHAGAGVLDPTTYFVNAWWTGIFATDCLSTNVINGFVGANLVRNCVIDRYFNDAFPGCMAVINCTVKNGTGGIGANGYAYHSDVWQERSPSTAENVVLYGITATENCNQQGVFSRTDGHRDVAIVNCSFNLAGYPNQSQWRTRSNHLVVLNNTFLGAPFCLGVSDTNTSVSGILGSRNTAFRNNAFQWVNLDDPTHLTGPGYPTYESIRASVVFENNHFINLWPAGSGPSSGQGIWAAQPLGTNATVGPAIRAGVGAYGNGAPPAAQN